MNLSEEERRRIYEEEKARIESRQQIEREQARQKARDKRNGWLVILGIVVLIIVGSNLAHHQAPTVSPDSTATTPLPYPQAKTGEEMFANAEAMFNAGDISSAAFWNDRALQRAPGTPKMLAFRDRINASIGTPVSSTTTATTPHATLKVVITTYEIPSYSQNNDEVKVQGTVENIGPDAVFSPDLIGDLQAKDGTLLGQDIEWPAGQSFSTMAPGTKAAFSMLIFSHGQDIRKSGAGVRLWTKAKGVTLDIHWPK